MPRILVADDNSNIQKMVALALEERGIDVVSVGNGEAAVRRIPDLAPDLVLADVFMPVRNGYEVCEFVKTNERFSHVPVILLVGAFDPLDEKEARRVGADGVLKKPFVPPDPLIAMVTSALEKNPHVAAEMEKAREAPAPPEPELPAIALEPPARMTPKPLPDFPEPSPEEAALIYGFEKKKIEKSDDEESEESRPRFSRKKADSDEDLDHATTTSRDWRRGAADFEIPDDFNSKAIMPDEGFSSVVFPSEHNAPAKRVSVPDPEPEEVPRASTPSVGSVPGLAAADEEASPRPIGFTAALSPSAPESRISAHEEPKQAAQPEQAASTRRPEPEQSADGDGLPSPSEYAEDGWMSALLGKFRRGKAPHDELANAENAKAAEPPAQSIPLVSETIAASPKPFSPPSETPSQAIVPAWPSGATSQESAMTTNSKGPIEAEQPESSFFAAESEETPDPPSTESWFAPNPTSLDDSEPSHETASVFSAHTAGNLLASPADVNDDERSQFSAGPDADSTFETAPHAQSGFASEAPSAYVQSSSSDRPTDEGPEHAPFSGTLDDDSRASEDAAKASELPQAFGSRQSSDDAASQERLSSIFAPPLAKPVAAAPAAPPSATPANESNERIPTTPPPSREAIADIPFLMPPPPAPFEPPTASINEAPKATESAEPPTVDAVVSRLLEKLQPQIHDMLAKDLLKPIVENLLQQELTNKSK